MARANQQRESHPHPSDADAHGQSGPAHPYDTLPQSGIVADRRPERDARQRERAGEISRARKKFMTSCRQLTIAGRETLIL
ncbi:hypothetical protein LMG27177_04150 [Paraburkholderia fynbosensis]|uniref:Uncharacterized protein n=1 Tax=Paraburkholderia fynbosensis TaxID=1200993 RepID=A0A6J5GAN7_9BURK|nr:hypothetical protein LMG27177_04150 [Paraburkholderia fynbosensis]